MSTELYYFSRTGNSLYVTKELQKSIPYSNLIPIVNLLQKDVKRTNAKTVCIVFPVHALTIPYALKKFLKKADMNSSEYIFAIATRGGTIFSGFKKIERLLKKKNKSLDAHFILNMYLNDPRDIDYKAPTEAEITGLETVFMERLKSIQRIIVNKKASREKDSDYITGLPYNRLYNYILEKLILLGPLFYELLGGVNYYYSDSKCSGCGICEKVCLSQKIKMTDKKPVWQKDVICYMCYACVNYCPKQSVQISDIKAMKSFTTKNGRYSHPYATVKEISMQK